VSAKEARKICLGGVFVVVNKGYGCVNESPVACSGVDPAKPIAGLSVTFNATGSYDPDGSGGINGIFKFEWDWENDGTYDHIETYPCDGIATHTFTSTGQKTVKIRVTDGEGAKDTTTRTFDVGNVIYVDVDSYPFHDGTTWVRAFVDIQDALDIASNGNEIWVAEGTYVLSSGMSINKSISIYGGFDGTESTLGDRDSFPGNTHTTTVDGDGSVSTCLLLTDDATIDGFTITNGNHGVFCSEADPTITNCIITGNGFSTGSGIYCSHSSPTITDSSISSNGKRGMSCYSSSAPTISNCVFSGNTGGGLYCSTSSSPTIEDCVFSGNTAEKGGGIYCFSSTAMVRRCVFYENRATYDSEYDSKAAGGGVYYSDSSVTLLNCLFIGNYCDYGDGGAVVSWSNEGTLYWTNCTFVENDARYGGVLFTKSPGETKRLRNCILCGNTADDGHEIYSDNYSTYYHDYTKLYYCDVDNSSGWKYDDPEHGAHVELVEENIFVDPVFLNENNPKGNDDEWATSDDGFMIQSTSECKDSGYNSYTYSPVYLLYDITATTSRRVGTVDRGAYEYDPN